MAFAYTVLYDFAVWAILSVHGRVTVLCTWWLLPK